MKASKRLVAIASCTGIVLSGIAPLAATAAPTQPTTISQSALTSDLVRYTRYTKGTVNVRSGPGSDYYVVKTLRKGTKVIVVETAYGWSDEIGDYALWSRISTGGWIRSAKLRK